MSDMSAIEFQGALAILRWTSAAVANSCGYSRQSGNAWETGRHRIPAAVAAWLDLRLAGQLVDPPTRE